MQSTSAAAVSSNWGEGDTTATGLLNLMRDEAPGGGASTLASGLAGAASGSLSSVMLGAEGLDGAGLGAAAGGGGSPGANGHTSTGSYEANLQASAIFMVPLVRGRI